MKKGVVVALFMTLLLAVPTLAASYSVVITVTESGSTSYTMLPVVAPIDNQNLIDLHIMTSTGLDTRVLQGFAELPHMVADDKVLFALPVSAGTQYPLEYTFGNTPLASFPVITGCGGYVTVADAAALELGNNFSIEFDGWLDVSSADTIYPTIAATATSSQDTTTSTSHTVALPSGVGSGDLLIVFFEGTGTGADISVTWPAGWTTLYSDPEFWYYTVSVAYRVANGTEGSSITVTTSPSCWSAHLSYRIIDFDSVPEIAALDCGTTANPDPPSLTPSWGNSSKTLWIAGCAGGSGTAKTVTVYPANYTGGQQRENVGDDCALVGGAYMNSTAASENPGAFNLSASTAETWGWTVGIRGTVEYMIGKPGACYVYTSAAGQISARILGGTPKTLTVSGLSSQECKVEAYADTTNFTVEVDDVVRNTTLLGGASVPNNSNNWSIAMPYYAYYKHAVNGTLVVWYQPITVISGTTLPDREGTVQNGVITWGSNPAGISVSVGALLPVSTSSAVVPGTSPDAGASLVPPTGNTSTLVPGIEGENLPFYGFFKGLLTSYHDDMGGPEISMPYFWKIVAMIIGWGLGTSVLIVTRHVAFGFLGYIIGFAVPAYAMGGLLDPWIPIVYGMTAACLAALIWKWTASAID